MTETPTLALARYASASSIERLPAEVKERARLIVVDEVACAFFGRRSLAGDLAARYAEQAGGPAESRIYATGKRVSAVNAALANGAAGHGEEVDGAHVVGGHPGASIVHAAVAVAERQRATGAELLNAVVLGYDVGVRIDEACGGLFSVKDRFKLNADFLYAFGCAAAAGRLLGFDPLRHCHALALTSFSTNSPGAFYAEKRHVSKSLCNGQFAAAGVQGALMAAAGLEGHEDTLGAPYGVLDAWGAEGKRDALTRGLGESFEVMRANFKMMNAGYPIHAPTEAALTILRTQGIAADRIAAVEVGLPTAARKVVDGRTMHNICLQDMLTAALVLGGLKLRESPFPDVLANPAFARIRPNVTLASHPDLDRDQPNGRGAIVTIRTTDGASATQRVDHPKGHSLRGGLTWDDLAVKWREGLPECDIDRMLAIGRRLDEIEDVREFLDVFRASGEPQL